MNMEAPLYGLVLAGGQSLRMGRDKSLLHWHGKEQRYLLYSLLQQFCTGVFISCRKSQAGEINESYQKLFDQYDNLGPLGGLLSAFDYVSHCAWLVVACDMPLVDKAGLYYLIQRRNTSLLATAYNNPVDNMPEPLLTIWEPEARPLLQVAAANGGGLRKILRANKTEAITPVDPSILSNANTPSEADAIKKMIYSRTIG